MSERINHCHKLGCKPNPSCCHNTIIDIHRKNLRTFPEALSYTEMQKNIAANPEEPVVGIEEPESILGTPSYYRLHIYKKCPRLDENDSCSVKDDPFRPDACEIHEIGGEYCNTSRKIDGRPLVSANQLIELSEIG